MSCLHFPLLLYAEHFNSSSNGSSHRRTVSFEEVAAGLSPAKSESPLINHFVSWSSTRTLTYLQYAKAKENTARQTANPLIEGAKISIHQVLGNRNSTSKQLLCISKWHDVTYFGKAVLDRLVLILHLLRSDLLWKQSDFFFFQGFCWRVAVTCCPVIKSTFSAIL